MKSLRLVGLGILSLIPYLFALRLQDLRQNTIDQFVRRRSYR